MQQIIRFIEKYRYFLLFLLLEFVALFFTIQSHSYHKSKFINSANSITGGFYKRANSINEFFHLKSENLRLSEENARLKNSLLKEDYTIDTVNQFQRYQYIPAKIFNNNYTKRNNYLTINKGLNDGVNTEMAVVNSKGVIGTINSVSNNYATVISVLNNYSLINAKLKNNNHFGTLSWDGKDYKTVQLNDIPRQAVIKIGDTIVTGGKSTIFPEGILIGIIKDFEQNQLINITLFNDMSALGNIQVITNLHKEEIQQLEDINNE